MVDGVHDMGGFHGFGRVETTNESTFKSEAEKRVYAMNMLSLMQRVYNIDKTRFYMENVPPADYLWGNYWERWLGMVERLYAEAGVSQAGGATEIPGLAKIAPEAVWTLFKTQRMPRPPELPEPLYTVGDIVRMKCDSVPTHTRLPRFVRGRSGRIERYLGIFRFADAFASDRVEHHHVYSVRFTGEEMWGVGGEANTSVQIEIYEPYVAEVVRRAS